MNGVALGGVHAFDTRIMEFLADHRTPQLDWIALRAETLGTPASMSLGALLLVIWAAWTRRLVDAGALVAAGTAAVLMTHGLKIVFSRDRPPTTLALVPADGPSFPSTAVTITTAVVLVILLRIAWPVGRARIPATIGALLLVGLSSWAVMYLGAHWFTDVLAGFLLGSSIGAACATAAAAVSAVSLLATSALRSARGPTSA